MEGVWRGSHLQMPHGKHMAGGSSSSDSTGDSSSRDSTGDSIGDGTGDSTGDGTGDSTGDSSSRDSTGEDCLGSFPMQPLPSRPPAMGQGWIGGAGQL